MIEAIRLAALLHDIGHPPFSHVIENVLSDIYKKLENEKIKSNKSVKKYIKCIKKFKKNGKQLHEEIGIYIVDKYIRKSIIKKDSNSKEVINLIFNFIINIYNEYNHIYKSLHSIIDSSLDGDRLDYLTRDYINSGINNGIINYTRIISSMKLIYDKKEYKFCFPIKSLSAIEDVLQRRFNLYKNILYHNRVIKTNFLLSDSIESLIESHLKNNYDKNNEDYIKYSNDISGLWKLLLNKKYISQWNDAWIFNLLKNVYFNKNNKLFGISKYSIEELITNRRHYHSLIKRIEDFKVIDDSRLEVINNLLKKKEFKLQSILIGDLKDDDIKNENYYIKNGFCISEYLIRANEIIENIEGDIENLFSGRDYYIVFLDKSTGISKEINLFKDIGNNNYELFKLQKISNINNVLNSYWKYFPSFYIYTKKEYEDYNKKIKELKNIGKKIWYYIFNKLIDINKKGETNDK